MKFIAIYGKQSDAQVALNQLVETGIEEENVSLIMKAIDETEVSYESSDLNSGYEDDYGNNDNENDEEDVFDVAKGTLEPLESIEVTTINGQYVIAGPLIKEYEDSTAEDLTISAVLMSLGLEESDIASIESRLDSGQILLSTLSTTENEEELRVTLTGSDPELFIEVEN